MTYDVWFSRAGNKLIFAYAEHDEAPIDEILWCKSVRHALKWMVTRGLDVAQVGICPPEMLGI